MKNKFLLSRAKEERIKRNLPLKAWKDLRNE